ncbi:hypothetical protein [Oxynema aestuarii]|uniref:Uncharacterized protein n=1 Tax=Oxynema aestuarii AP17 TaxID=2064643 RepID=A0A6H1TY98_9CYAN|nr:hypothetical protein [Oxynema aestuarii]QIZ71588.1 hypothetical protein HCG48_14170 [Oxynema aestuarii AP17]
MTYFNSAEPILRWKQEDLDIQDLQGLWRINWQIGRLTLIQRFYTRIDLVFVFWGWIVAAMFAIAQFCPISWQIQAGFWTIVSLLGTAAMAYLSWFWVTVEKLRWLVYSWSVLIGIGLVLTDASIFYGWAAVLIRLCPLWLMLTAIGYFLMALGMRSRTFAIAALLHVSATVLLPSFSAWQFLFTGATISATLLLLAELQWDMRPPIDSDVLTPQQREFNRQQQQRRQLSGC